MRSLQLLPLLALASLVSPVCRAQQMPRFKPEQSDNLMWAYSSSKTYKLGQSNRLMFLRLGNTQNFGIQLEGGQCKKESITLRVKCPGNKDFLTVPLTASGEVCDNSLKLKSIDQKTFQITILKLENGAKIEMFRKIEIKVKVQCDGVSLNTGTLFLWDLQGLSTWNEDQKKCGELNCRLRFITQDGVQFLAKLNKTDEFGSVDFIESEVVKAVNKAPSFIKSSFYIGARIKFAKASCRSSVGKSLRFVNFAYKMQDTDYELSRFMFLNISDGKLYYTIKPITDMVIPLSNEENGFALCAIVGIQGNDEIYEDDQPIMDSVGKDAGFFSYSSKPGSGSSCYLPGGVTSKSMTVFSGVEATLLLCPIVCSSATAKFTFEKDGQSIFSRDEKDYYTKSVRLPKILKSEDSGKYECSAGDKTFTFDVRVASLPRFDSEGALPSRIYAMEGEQLSYRCTAAFLSVSVTLTPKFEVLKGGRWQTDELDAFKSTWPALTISVTGNPSSKTLTLNVSKVPKVDPILATNFTHRFVCHASASPFDAEKLGMESYSVQTGADVFLLKRPTHKDFTFEGSNCSRSACPLAEEASFSVSMSEEMTRQLKSVGVQVDAFFILNNTLLQDYTFAQKFGEITFNNATNTLKFLLKPMTEDWVHHVKFRSFLFPVFNFKYGDSATLKNIVLRINRTGNLGSGSRDCAQDSRCFYSTQFDIDNSLKTLVRDFHLGGKAAPATASIPWYIIVLVAILLLVIIAVLIVFAIRRDPGQVYLLDEKERQQGNHPEQEAKDEVFKEYQRPEEGPLKASRLSLASDMSVNSNDDQELDDYGEIDCGKFGEDGSFIGDYSTDTRKREVFDASARGEQHV